jgi:hypothetical protein
VFHAAMERYVRFACLISGGITPWNSTGKSVRFIISASEERCSSHQVNEARTRWCLQAHRTNGAHPLHVSGESIPIRRLAVVFQNHFGVTYECVETCS